MKVKNTWLVQLIKCLAFP